MQSVPVKQKLVLAKSGLGTMQHRAVHVDRFYCKKKNHATLQNTALKAKVGVGVWAH